MKWMVFRSAILALCAAALVAEPTFANPAAQDPNAISESHNSRPSSPQYAERVQEAETDYKEGKAAMGAQDFVTAETDFRAAISVAPAGYLYFDLAKALTEQGRVAEAIQTYRTLFYELPVKNCIGSDDPAVVETYRKEFAQKLYADPTRYSRFGSKAPDAWMRYALLLNQTGQWKEAVHFYEAALPDVPDGKVLRASANFNSESPQPRAFAAAVHVALGRNHAFGGELDSNDKAMGEYQQALQLAPSWGTANYYYGYGWQRLDPKNRARIGSVQQAKAALQKAVLLCKGDLKKAAQKALKSLNKPV